MVLKKQMPIHEAIIETINQAFPTIFTSGTILTGAGFLIGQIASDATVASIGIALGRGTLIFHYTGTVCPAADSAAGRYHYRKDCFDN